MKAKPSRHVARRALFLEAFRRAPRAKGLTRPARRNMTRAALKKARQP